MQTYELTVTNRSVTCNSDDNTLVRTSIGIDQIHVMFDNAEWLSFPLTVTFGNGDTMVTVPMSPTSVTDSYDWAAEGTAVIPWEVARNVGPIRVTFQGTDASGNHIITAKGSPLRVEESGDVTLGEIPESAPTVSQYEQVYADAVEKIAELSEALGSLDDVVRKSDYATESEAGIVRPDGTTLTVGQDGTISVVEQQGGLSSVDDIPVATRTSLGVVMVGSGLSVTEYGSLSANIFTQSQIETLTPLGIVLQNGDGIGF